MRLAIFTSKYPARVATFFERDVRALLAAGVDVDIFPIYPVDAGLWRYSDGIVPRRRVHHVGLASALARLRVWPFERVRTFLRDAAGVTASAARFGAGPLAKSAYVFPKAWAWAHRFPNTFDHVLAYWGNYAGTCAYAFHRLTGGTTPFSIWLHAGADLYYQPVFLRRKLAYADRIITCCEFNRGFLQQHFPALTEDLGAKVHVCYHGLDLPAFPFAPNHRRPGRIIAVGTLERLKGFDDLLRAAQRLARRGVTVEIELVGDGPEARPLRALADALGIADRVTIRGWLPFPEVQAAMQRATVLVHPSPELGDGLPNVIREAMAVGTPVIATRIAGIPEALDDGRCGVLVPPKNVPALADAIAALLPDESRRQRLAELARRRTEALFDMWRNGARLAELLRTTPARRGAPAARNESRVARTA